MNDRKKNVIKMAHQLFVENGFQNTSIQDILDYSGISKGTFYNYFSSKNELLIAIFKTLFEKLDRERNELLIGQDPADIEVFTRQIELQMRTSRANKLLSLFEEVFVSDDDDLKEFLKQSHLRALHWTYQRFIDIFGKNKKTYLLDCAIMFSAILNQNMKFQGFAYESKTSIHKVVSYSVARIVKTVEELAEAGEQLIPPEILDKWMPDYQPGANDVLEEVKSSIAIVENYITDHEEQAKYTELLRFIEDELVHSNNPREFLIESALTSLKGEQALATHPELLKLEQVMNNFLNK